MKTPTTRDGLTQYDRLPATRAAELAWTQTGPHPHWHARTQTYVAKQSPLLAYALEAAQMDRLPAIWNATPTRDQARIANAMPLLARALQRATDEE